MIELEKARTNSAKGRKKRYRYGDIFFNMLQYQEDKWNFDGPTEHVLEELLPYYEKLKAVGIESLLRGFAGELADYRNGFDHAWTLKAGAASDIEEKGRSFFEKLELVVKKLVDNRILH